MYLKMGCILCLVHFASGQLHSLVNSKKFQGTIENIFEETLQRKKTQVKNAYRGPQLLCICKILSKVAERHFRAVTG